MMSKNTNNWQKHFETTNKLGEGGNASVFHVIRKVDGTELALKQLYNKNTEKKSRFIDEIQVITDNWETIKGIIPIENYSIEDYWYTMPIAVPVLEHIHNSKESIESIIGGSIQLSETLMQLHSKEISHRDIKPSNLYFYNERYCIGDFGLVDFPDNPNDFTRSDKGLGAIFTIAPEMKRDPKNADGKKADVFSLAKTIWMLLTGNDRGFDGVYNFLDKSHSLRFMDKFNNIHLVELEELLTKATNNDPNLRPSIEIFKQELELWLDVYNDFEKSQFSDWYFLNKYLFGDNSAESTVWRNPEKIVNVLNVIGTLPAYNHLFFSDGGGLDFSKAEQANEPGCIYLYDSIGFHFILKPKYLIYEGFNEDYGWNYFLLELDELTPILGSSSNINYEYLVEDYPAHYVSAKDSQYGVYDYDSGDPLPEGYQVVQRYLQGKFLIVLKNGPYNAIPATYDGRHGACSNNEFRDYINKLIEAFNKLKDMGYDEEQILNLNEFGKNPFETIEEFDSYNTDRGIHPGKFIEENYQNWCFANFLAHKDDECKFSFNITFKANSSSYRSFFSDDKYYLCKDGYIKKLNKDNLSEAYNIYSREEAIRLREQCNYLISDICNESGFDKPEYESFFSITLKKSGKPTHLFTKSEIEEEMRKADDRSNNLLVIDENGFAKVIQNIGTGKLYPVRHESWNAGNMYVGKYSKLSTLDDVYLTSLQGWLTYLESGKSVYMDYTHENIDIDTLIKEIKEYY